MSSKVNRFRKYKRKKDDWEAHQRATKKRMGAAKFGGSLLGGLATLVTGGAAAPAVAALLAGGATWAGSKLGDWWASQSDVVKESAASKYYRGTQSGIDDLIGEQITSDSLKAGVMAGLSNLGGKLSLGKGGVQVSGPQGGLGASSTKNLFTSTPTDAVYADNVWGKIGKTIDFKGSQLGRGLQAHKTARLTNKFDAEGWIDSSLQVDSAAGLQGKPVMSSDGRALINPETGLPTKSLGDYKHKNITDMGKYDPRVIAMNRTKVDPNIMKSSYNVDQSVGLSQQMGVPRTSGIGMDLSRTSDIGIDSSILDDRKIANLANQEVGQTLQSKFGATDYNLKQIEMQKYAKTLRPDVPMDLGVADADEFMSEGEKLLGAYEGAKTDLRRNWAAENIQEYNIANPESKIGVQSSDIDPNWGTFDEASWAEAENELLGIDIRAHNAIGEPPISGLGNPTMSGLGNPTIIRRSVYNPPNSQTMDEIKNMRYKDLFGG
tara:strand:+ start:1836 stop:3308 length:1473 start_codon:yes stop_codon:yes gene_type:complete